MNHVDTTKTITHLSLCTGYEGIGRGLRRVLPNVREIAYVEIEAFAITNLANKMEKGQLHPAPIYTNLKTFPYRKFRGRVDIMSFGFPCQPFSQAGLRKATEDPRHLFPFLAEGIRECKPKLVFAENVEGILSCKTGEGEPVLKYVGRTLEEMGYTVEIGIFSASEVGFPHQRKRVFILGMANDICGRINRGRSSQECTDGREGILSHEGEWNEVWSEAEGCCDSSREELGNTEHHGTQTSKNLRSCDEASDTLKEGKERSLQSEGASRSDMCTSIQGCEELVNTDCEGFQGHSERQEWTSDDPWQTSKWMATQVPARPTQAQYEWEAPRVISQMEDTDIRGLENTKEIGWKDNDAMLPSGESSTDKGISESRLGGATNGFTNRVDRLRLLGNGVCEYTAAKAFGILLNKITSE